MEEEKKMIKINHRRWEKKIIAIMKKKNLLYPLDSITMDYYTCFVISFF